MHCHNNCGSSRKVGGANKGLGEAPNSCTRKEYESATNSIAKRGQGAIAPCRVKGQRPLWGLGQRPNCSASDQHRKRTQQRRRQRSVPASNFARPQTRPQAAFPQDSVKNYNCDAYMEICAAAEGFASADATRGHENRRSLRSPPRPLRCTLPYLNCIGSFIIWKPLKPSTMQ